MKIDPADLVAAIERSDAHVRPIMAAGAAALTIFYAAMARLEKRREHTPTPRRPPPRPPTPDRPKQ